MPTIDQMKKTARDLGVKEGQTYIYDYPGVTLTGYNDQYISGRFQTINASGAPVTSIRTIRFANGRYTISNAQQFEDFAIATYGKMDWVKVYDETAIKQETQNRLEQSAVDALIAAGFNEIEAKKMVEEKARLSQKVEEAEIVESEDIKTESKIEKKK